VGLFNAPGARDHNGDDTDEVAIARSDAGAVIEAIDALGGAEQRVLSATPSDAIPYLILPRGKRIESLKRYVDEWRGVPERRDGTAILTTLTSFIAHVNRFKDDESVVFVDDVVDGQVSLVGVLDYHPKGAGGARWLGHRATYTFPFSTEWRAWTEAAAKPLTQVEFAELLEDRVADVLPPQSAGESLKTFAQNLGIQLASPARLLELSKGLSVRVEQRVSQAVNLSTGEVQLNFEEQHADKDGGQAVRVPGGFAVAIPVFKNGPLYQVPVRLRYRVTGGRVVWLVSLGNADRVVEDAIGEAVAEVEKATALPVLYGRPEAASKRAGA
jgi:uncharacterized protein YfdQ (DUF2303 family)